MSRSESSADDAAAKLAQVLPAAAVDALLADAEASGTLIDGPDGLLAQITKSVLERALDVEIADHLGYEQRDPAGNGSGNSRNGHGRKTMLTTAGPVDLEVPRDRNGTFDPQIVQERKAVWGTPTSRIVRRIAAPPCQNLAPSVCWIQFPRRCRGSDRPYLPGATARQRSRRPPRR